MSDTTHLTVTAETLLALHAPTPESARKVRQGPGGKPLTYVDSRYVQQVLDSEIGPGNWQDEYLMGDGGKVACRIGIFIDDRGWVWKGDGAGATDIEGDKGSFSDAFKRAAVKWGIARDLYSEGTTTSGPAVAPTAAPTTAPAAVPLPQPVAAPSPEGGDICPVHGWTWTVQPGGTSKAGKEYHAFYKCGGKTDGRYCTEKPSKEWADAHPIAS